MKKVKNRKRNSEGYKLIFFQVGMIFALLSVLYAFEYRSYGFKYEIDDFGGRVDDTPTEFIEPTKHDEPKKEPPKPPIVKINVDDLKDDFKPEDIDFDASDNQDTPVKDWEPYLEPEPEIVEPDIVIKIPSIMPEFVGGYGAMMEFLKSNIVYPEIAKKLNRAGTVYVKFIVEKDGSITNINILRGIGSGCDEEALRVVNLMPNWNPGLQNGRAVRVSFNLPIKFSLL